MVQFRGKILVAGFAMIFAGVTVTSVQAQDHAPDPTGPAPILMTVRELVQPGAEATHAKMEAEYAATLDAGHGSQFYLGMGAITGTPQTLFLSGYSSLEEMADVHDLDDAAMGGKLAALDESHSGTLAATDTAIWRLRPDLSNPNPENLAKMRLIELVELHVKLGHEAEFTDAIKHTKDEWLKADPDFHYSVYRQIFGDSGDDSYIVIIPMKSLADLDKHHAMVAQYQKGVGEDAQKQMMNFESANYNSTESNLFIFTPSMSRLPESWTKDDLDFWKPKMPAAAPAPAKKATTPK